MTAVWQPGTTYVPGSIVRPTSVSAVALPPVFNGDFETGDLTNWSPTGSGTWSVGGSAYQGTYKVTVIGGGIGALEYTIPASVFPGQSITATAYARLTNAGTDDLGAEVAIYWTDASHAFISQSEGGVLTGVGGSWHQLGVTAVAPSNAAYAQVVLGSNTGSHGGRIDYDVVTWTSNFVGPPAGLLYKATQAAPGKSGSTEPVWPLNTTTPVTDNQVTWQGVIATQLVWTASPINRSGATEPVWPTAPNASVNDNGIDWVATVPVITDPNCPQSKIVAIAASKVYAADNDIIRYSATVNPLDWSSANNAGYLPFGLQNFGDNPAAAMNLYRSNLVVFSAVGFQMWQVDEDPVNTALLDALPIATTQNEAMTPVANDLLFLSSKGVRSMGISATGVNLEAGDVGMPIDPLVIPDMQAAIADGTHILSTFVPADAQYWIAFSTEPVGSTPGSSEVFVYTLNRINAPGRWSRYLFPFQIDAFTQLNDTLYIRSGDDVLRMDQTALQDYQGDTQVPSRAAVFEGIVQTPWIDFGSPGVTKRVDGFDIVGQGTPQVAFGYDESNPATFTTDYTVPPDSVPGMMIPMPIMCASASVRVTYPGGQKWKLQAMNVWLWDMRRES
jgi:hypothetical protein